MYINSPTIAATRVLLELIVSTTANEDLLRPEVYKKHPQSFDFYTVPTEYKRCNVMTLYVRSSVRHEMCATTAQSILHVDKIIRRSIFIHIMIVLRTNGWI